MINHEPAGLRKLQQHELAGSVYGRWSIAVQVATLLASDLLALTCASFFGYLTWAYFVLHQTVFTYLGLTPLLALFPASYAAAGLYPGFGIGAVETLRRQTHCTNASFLAIAASTFVFKADPNYSRLTFALIWVAALIAVPLFRFTTLLIVKPLRWWGKPIIIFGTPTEVIRVITALRHAFALGYRVAGIVLSSESGATDELEGIPVLGGMESLTNVHHSTVDTILLWDGFHQPRTLDLLHRHVGNVVLIRDGHALPIEHIRLRNLGGVLGIEFKSDLLNRRNANVKRAIDLVFGTILLVAGSPLILFFGAIVKLLSPGPMFFSQEREGLHGARFRVWKLRTMYPNAEQLLARHLEADSEARQQWHRSVKLLKDPRVVPLVGNFMRLMSIDELPQLWNIVSGTMSLVGPRPFPEYHLARFRPDFRELRTAVRPGLTGMWQVIVRSDGSIEDQERFDTYYIRNWSLWLDIYLIARTVFAVLGRRGAR